MWVPASAHRDDHYDDEDDVEEEEDSIIANGETRGRENERIAA
jgi:hypothetical protein